MNTGKTSQGGSNLEDHQYLTGRLRGKKKEYMHVYSSVIHNTQRQPKCPSTDERINKIWCIHTMECYSALNKEGNSITCYSIDEPGGC